MPLRTNRETLKLKQQPLSQRPQESRDRTKIRFILVRGGASEYLRSTSQIAEICPWHLRDGFIDLKERISSMSTF